MASSKSIFMIRYSCLLISPYFKILAKKQIAVTSVYLLFFL
ncbi:hypothetical protein SPAR148_0876 [Streptococcus pneumoniae GA17545]|nr:hypothetical protein SPAR148_0876 [Streptococcus pneumoniae GA17545]EHE01508.1 hypothetical protein SPAR43_0934 [Streptococcus pneumoniae GA17227]EHZ30110.1 hypothetical protein SPAR46_0925 [Streptococcus pneumoniae GA17457]